MQRFSKAVFVACTLVLSACAVTNEVSDSETGVQTASAAPTCMASSLSAVWGEPDGAAGTTYQSVTFTNDGDVTCVATESPKVSLTSHGTPLVSLFTRGEGDLALPFSLEPGQSLVLTIGITSPDNFDDADCQRAKADGLTVTYASGTTVHLDKALGDVCTKAQAAPFIESWETLIQ